MYRQQKSLESGKLQCPSKVAMVGMLEDLRQYLPGSGSSDGKPQPAALPSASATAARFRQDPFAATNRGLAPAPVAREQQISAAEKAAAEERKKETTLVRTAPSLTVVSH